MKINLWGLLIIVILAIVATFFVAKSCIERPILHPQDNTQELNLKVERDSLDDHIAELSKMVDSLQTIKQQIKKEIIIRERQIDENIAKDSSNSISEYRRSLQDNRWLPDNLSDNLTYKEIGIGGKLMARIPKMQLQINLCEEQNIVKDAIIKDHKFIKKSYQTSLNIKQLEVNKYREIYEKESAWYNSNWIWFGIGAVAAGGAVYLAGQIK